MKTLLDFFNVPAFNNSFLALLSAFLVAAVSGISLYWFFFWWVKYLTPEGSVFRDAALLRRTAKPLKYILPILLFLIILPGFVLPAAVLGPLRQMIAILLIASIAWLAVSLGLGGKEVLLKHYDVNAKDNLKARAIHTQVNVLLKVLTFVVVLVATSLILMTFEKVRQVGISILASAGVIGIVVGFAAQKSIATLFAGLQIAITQPIRIDDVVIVEGEWGRIEEITLTYVVVRIWDLRRLVVPVTYFLEKPFQNWTRMSADILGTVFLYTDYTVPVDEVEKKLREILDEEPHWDRKVWGLQITNTTDRSLELRALMGAPDASAAWDLRCSVRKKLVRFLQEKYPEALPRVRAAIVEAEDHRDEKPPSTKGSGLQGV